MADLPSPSPEPAPAPQSGPPPAPRRRLAGWHFAVSYSGYLVKVLALLALLGAAAWWTLGTPAGTAWLLRHVPLLQVEGAQGTLWGDFQAQRIELPLPGAGGRVLIEGLAWRGLRIGSAPGALWLRLRIADLRAARVTLRLGDNGDAAPPAPPERLDLPLAIDIAALQVDELVIEGLDQPPIRDLRARLQLGADGGRLHRVQDLQATWDRLRLQAQAQIGTRGTLALQASALLTQTLDDGGEWVADAQLEGPLAAPQLNAQLRARTGAQSPEQTLQLQAGLRPFATWPLGELRAQARALDLRALHRAAPVTALDLDATAVTVGMDQPAQLSITLRNAQPGRWNEGRLPLRALSVALAARPDNARDLRLDSFDAQLGTAQTAAGRVSGSGQWQPGQWQLDLRLDALQPALLDARAPTMRLDGPLTLAGTGFDAANLEQARVELRGDVRGQQLDGSTPVAQRAVQLKLDASLGLLLVQLNQVSAQAGDASATLSGRLSRRSRQAGWQAEGQAALQDFDPKPWWPGASDSPWRQGPHELNAQAAFTLQLPAAPASGSWTGHWPEARGRVAIDVAPSRLAGVPISGHLALQAQGDEPATLVLALDADGNRLKADGQLSPVGPGGGDRWNVSADMPTLNRLLPLWKLLRGTGGDARLSGSLSGSAQASGRWPALGTRGELQVKALQLDNARLGQASAEWQLGHAADDPLTAKVDASQLAFGPASVDTAQLRLDGSLRSHRLEARAVSKSLPPSWVESLQAAPSGKPGGAAARRTEALLRLRGGVVDSAAHAIEGWRGSLQQLEVRGDASDAPAWLSVGEVPLELLWADGPARVAIGAGRAELLGAQLRVDHVDWRAAVPGGAATLIDAQAELEPLPVAPLLNRLQPGFGWGGDLRLHGRLKLRSTPGFSADVVLERSAGDLSVTDDSGTRALGLSDLRLGLIAEAGVWNFSAGLAGTTMGVAAGALVVNAGGPADPWPGASAPVQGVLELQVEKLGVWGPWLPAGWRLSGAVHVGAAIGGTFGAPQYTGTLSGRALGVRNVLQGVDVHDGEVQVALQGDSARIERFSAQAGAGTLRLSGDASLGEKPRADLLLELDKFQLLGRVDRRIVTSGQAKLRFGKELLSLDGELKIDEGLIDFSRSDAPKLGDDVQVLRTGDAKAPQAIDRAAPELGLPAPAGRKIDLDLRVLLGDKLRLRGQGLNTGLRGDLRLSAPQGKLRVDGSIRTADGTYKAYRQNLVIDRGVITFNGAVENPQLDIEATRPNLDVRVGVAVTGTVLVPRIRLFSDPAMTDVERLSWLLRGRASEGQGADTALLQAAALALASGDEPGALDQIMNTIGLDDFSVREGDGTSGSSGGTIVSVGKQLSRNWYIGYERSLNAATGNWQLIYRLAQRFTVRAQSGAENSLSLIWSWRWQ